MILDKIIEVRRDALAAAKRRRSLAEVRSMAGDVSPALDFGGALKGQEKKPALIAELKKASPSRGLIRPDFDPVRFASIYEEKGAAAISVLTEESFFQGNPEFLPMVRNHVGIPLLRKDFITDPYQVYEARALRADAILLIAAILDHSKLEDLSALASDLGMDTLLEVHDADELDTAIGLGAPIIGINNRNLKTMEIRIETSIELAATIPPGRIVVAESGISSRADVERVAAAGIQAMLIGTSLMKSEDIGEKIDELLGHAEPEPAGTRTSRPNHAKRRKTG